jgi:protein-tyrosine phosphatase
LSLIRREFIVRYNNIEKRVIQLQMLSWPDHYVPEAETGYNTLEYLLSAVSECKANYANSPVLVHCSAGTGRTGTFIAVHNIIKSLQMIKYINQSVDQFHKIKPFFSVFNLVRKLREQRMFMITSQAQYGYIYDFALEWIRRNFEPIEN